MITNRGELLAILLGENIADVLHGKNLRDLDINDAHVFCEIANYAASTTAKNKLLGQHQETVKIKSHRFALNLLMNLG